jgi:hypothetical protein
MATWFDENSLSLAFGIAYASGEFGGAVPFFLGSLLESWYPKDYAERMLTLCSSCVLV